MRILIPKETRPHEARVAVTPDVIKKYIALGCEVIVETGAGQAAGILDQQFIDAGAQVTDLSKKIYADTDVVLSLHQHSDSKTYSKDTTLFFMSDILTRPLDLQAYADGGVNLVAIELLPRITRAQTMDVLSSQNNLAGYQAVIEAASLYPRVFPLMMTAAGTLLAAKVLVVGVGVAGLQAIATARRLGAIVMGYDVRRAAKEQVQSLGATFVEVNTETDAETAGGYAQEMSEAYKAKEQAKLKEVVSKVDIIITTALIPGRPAPMLISEDMVRGMKPGSVIIDLAAASGGNCALTRPGRIVEEGGVRIVGPANSFEKIARDASDLYARNLYNLFILMWDATKKKLMFNEEDEIVKAITLTCHGKVMRPDLETLNKTTHKKEKVE